MDPVIFDGSLNIFMAGTDGTHCGKPVCVGRFEDNGRLESVSCGIVTVAHADAEWSLLELRLDFLNSRYDPIALVGPWRYRIISEWYMEIDRLTHQCIGTGDFSIPCGTPPSFDDWLTMPVEKIVRLAAVFPTPPEVFRKNKELVLANPLLCRISMTNFDAFERWIDGEPAILERLEKQRRDNRPRPYSLEQMISDAWVCRSRSFRLWADEVIEPFFRHS